MGTISVPNSFSTGDSVTAAKLNANNTTIYNEFNGSIDNANIDASAAIASTKLDLANGVAIAQTKTTGSALDVTRDLASASTNDAVAQITQDNSGDDQNVVNIQNDGTGKGLYIDQNANGVALHLDNAGTSAALDVDQTGNGTSIEVDNDGTGHGVYIHQDGVLASSKYALWVYSNAVQNASSLAFIEQDNSSSDQNTLSIQNDGTGDGLFIDQNNSGNAIEVDADYNGASTMTGLDCNINNAGSGDSYGAVFTVQSGSGTAFAFKAAGDTTSGSGVSGLSNNGKIRIKRGTTTCWIPTYS